MPVGGAACNSIILTNHRSPHHALLDNWLNNWLHVLITDDGNHCYFVFIFNDCRQLSTTFGCSKLHEIFANLNVVTCVVFDVVSFSVTT